MTDVSSFLVDTPDPYVSITIDQAIEPTLRTEEVDNNKNPIWNQNLEFYIEPKLHAISGTVRLFVYLSILYVIKKINKK